MAQPSQPDDFDRTSRAIAGPRAFPVEAPRGGWGMTTQTLEVAETTLRAAVAERIGESRFGLGFGEGVRLGVAADALEVGVPNASLRAWIRGHFSANPIEAARPGTGRSLPLRFHFADDAPP